MVLQFLRGASKRDVPEQKASATGPVIAVHGAGRAVWSGRDVACMRVDPSAGV